MDTEPEKLNMPPLASAAALFRRLDETGVGYGAFKSTRTIPLGIAGQQDIDMLVRREDYARFCEVLSSFNAIRGVTHSSLSSLGREDWLVPDFETGFYMHLDAHVEVRLGGKFNKRYAFYRYDSIGEWIRISSEGCEVPAVSPIDEARITLSRIAFRVRNPPWATWVGLSGDWAHEIDELLFDSAAQAELKVSYDRVHSGLACRVRKHGGRIEVHAGDLREIRRAVRRGTGVGIGGAMLDIVVNRFRQARYFTARILNRLASGSVLDRRRPAAGGLVVALIAPDGMGKSVQVERLSKRFGWKFSTATLYLGIGDGKGWWIRRAIVRAYSKRRSSIRHAMGNDALPSADNRRPTLKKRLLAGAMAFWGLLAALERYSNARRARRMAARGFIVICDRWPQAVQSGYLDGPINPPDPALLPGLAWLARREAALYRRMAWLPPDISLHLVADYAVSVARKPGGVSHEGFRDRIALMARLRKNDPNAATIDASANIESVTSSLFTVIWRRL